MHALNRPLSILVVDDDDVFRQAIEKRLRVAFPAAFIVCATDGVDGVERCQFQTFDLIVTDLKMPCLTGLEMLASIRKSRIHTPAIVASSSDLPSGDLSEAGAFLFLPKHELNVLAAFATRMLGSEVGSSQTSAGSTVSGVETMR